MRGTNSHAPLIRYIALLLDDESFDFLHAHSRVNHHKGYSLSHEALKSLHIMKISPMR